MIIGGEKTSAQDGKRIEVYNPATGELIDTIPSAAKEDIEIALDFAQKGKVEWAQIPLHERCKIIKKFADLVDMSSEELAYIISKDTGKTLADAKGEMSRIGVMARGYAERANHLYSNCLCDAQPGMEKNITFTIREPLGVVVCLIPFNYPASLFTQKVAPALVMGNVVIIKPPTDNPLTCIRLTELLLEAGVPGNAVQVVTGRGALIGDYLVPSPKVNAVSLTGSTGVGVTVAEMAAKNLQTVLLELGGNDPLIIFEDADLELAVNEAIVNRAPNAGQTCGATKRLIVQNSVKERFTDMLIKQLSKIRVGDPSDPQTDVGCLISEKAAIEVEEQVNHTIKQGARCVLGGKRFNRTFFEMTVLADVTADMDVAKDLEIFGPIFPIIGFDTDEEAIEIANSSQYGLNGGVMTHDFNKAMKIALNMECGGVVIGASGQYRPPEFPFGGYKMSGLGREGISATLEEMSQLKAITLKACR